MAFSDYLGPLATILAGVGASNWMFTEFLDFNLVTAVSMGVEPVAAVTYLLAGVAGLGAIASGGSMLLNRLSE